jgi:hypothetical protein
MSDDLDKIISYYNMPVKRKLSNDFLMQELVDKIEQLDEANEIIIRLCKKGISLNICVTARKYLKTYKAVSDE